MSKPGVRRTQFAIIGAGLALVVGLIVAGFNNRQNLNADAIAYMRIATYYGSWKTDLMVSGYWGPLLSWVMVPFLKLGFAPLDSARFAMGISAVVFWVGNLFLWRSLKLPSAGIVIGAWLSAFAAAAWSVAFITPDLLVAGLICAAFACMASDRWLAGWKGPLLAGVFWAVAYYAKAIALPLTVVISVSLVVLRWIVSPGDRHRLARPFGITLLVFGLLATPWVTVLSLKYQRLTFSTSARIAHALAGPADTDQVHPIGLAIHQPEPGRITTWEDPSRMDYHYWSPFESQTLFRHQLRVMKRNAITVGCLLGRFDAMWLGLIATCVVLLPGPCWREKLASERWRWGIALVVCLAAIHLPVRVESTDQRYFLVAWPFLFAAATGVTLFVTARLAQFSHVLRWLILAVVTASFARPMIEGVPAALLGNGDPASAVAQDVAIRMRGAGLRGPLAGSGMFAGARTGLYVAFLLDVPWYGDQLDPSAESIRKQSPRFFIVHRGSALTGELKEAAGFRDLDAVLLPDANLRTTYPLQVYEIPPR